MAASVYSTTNLLECIVPPMAGRSTAPPTMVRWPLYLLQQSPAVSSSSCSGSSRTQHLQPVLLLLPQLLLASRKKGRNAKM